MKSLTFATLALAGLISAPALAGPVPWDPDPIVGVWLADAVRRDCVSGAVLSPPFKGMQVFHHGGTLSDTNSNGPTTRGPGFGFWVRDSEGQYSAKFRFARYFSDGNLDGFTVITHASTLAANGLSLTNASRVEIRNASDFVVATVCASSESVRLQ